MDFKNNELGNEQKLKKLMFKQDMSQVNHDIK